MSLLGTYGGIVENVSDPEKLGRVKVRVPHVYGVSETGGGSLATNEIPWALPAGMPAGSSKSSGGFSHLPEIGDHVFVRFLDGEPEKPVWEWGMQTRSDAQSMPLHKYNESSKAVGNAKRAAWTRYGHTVELNPDSLLVTSSQGYRAEFVDGDIESPNGQLRLATPAGNLFEIDDDTGSWIANVNEDLNLIVGDSLSVQARSIEALIVDDIYVTGASMSCTLGGSFTLESDSASITSASTLRVMCSDLTVNSGSEPYVKGAQLAVFLNALLTWLDTHTHGNGNDGGPTIAPLLPASGVTADPETLLSSVIFGE